MRHAVPRHLLGLDEWPVVYAAASILHVIRRQHFPISSPMRQSQSIIMADHRREIADRDESRILDMGPALKGDDAVLGIRKVDPLKAVPICIKRVEGRTIAIQMIEISYQPLGAPVEV